MLPELPPHTPPTTPPTPGDGNIVTIRDLRRSLVDGGDIRDEISLQNDVNFLLARLEDARRAPWQPLGPLLRGERRRRAPSVYVYRP